MTKPRTGPDCQRFKPFEFTLKFFILFHYLFIELAVAGSLKQRGTWCRVLQIYRKIWVLWTENILGCPKVCLQYSLIRQLLQNIQVKGNQNTWCDIIKCPKWFRVCRIYISMPDCTQIQGHRVLRAKKYAQLRYRRVPNEWVAVGKYFKYGGEGVG